MNLHCRLLLAAALFASMPLMAADNEYELNIRDHRFEPAELTAPAGQKIKLRVHNLDTTPEEFESHELNREKVIPGGKSATIYLGPLQPGTYPFFGEFNAATAQGRLIVR